MSAVMESLVRRFDAIKPHLTERQRRVWLGSEARELGSGGVGIVADAVRVFARHRAAWTRRTRTTSSARPGKAIPYAAVRYNDRMATGNETVYDLAVSFASEHRDYVERTVKACVDLGLRVFYDRDKSNEWWGKSFIREQRLVYSSQTRYFVPFLSTEYLAKPIPMDEFSSAMMTAVKRGDGYVLPVLIGDVQIPPDLLHPHIHYLRAKDHTPEQLALQLQAKVNQAKAAGQQAREVGTVVQQALELRLPKVVPADFSKYEELQATFEYLGDQFQAAAPQLRPHGFICTVNRTHDRISIRIEHQGKTVYALDIYKGGSMGDDKLIFGLGHHRGSSGGMNGWAEPFFDKQSAQPKIKMTDLSVFGSLGSGNDREFAKDELFQALWDRIVDQLEKA